MPFKIYFGKDLFAYFAFGIGFSSEATLESLFLSPTLSKCIFVVSSSMREQQFLICHWLSVLMNYCTTFLCSMLDFIKSALKPSTSSDVSNLLTLLDSSFLALSISPFGSYLLTSSQVST